MEEEVTELSKEYFATLKRIKPREGNSTGENAHSVQKAQEWVIEEDKELLKKITESQKKCLDLVNEKILIGKQAYSNVENHIKNLDEKIKRFEKEMQEQGGDASLIDETVYDIYDAHQKPNNSICIFMD